MNIAELLELIDQGRFAIPEVQRGYVWRNSQVLELFRSIIDGLPIGSILLWNMPRDFVDTYSDLLRPLTDDLRGRSGNYQYMVIDGQQRLVSIYLVKMGTISVHGEGRKISLYVNPDNNNELKLARGRELDRDPHWFNLSALLSKDDVADVVDEKEKVLGYSYSLSGRRHVERRLNNLKNQILNYTVNIYYVSERTLSYNKDEDNFPEILGKISEMFVRLNSTGTRIKMPDLVSAILTARTRGEDIGRSFKNRLREITSEFESMGWDVEEPVLMRAYMAIATGKTKFREAKSVLEHMPARDIMGYLERTRDSLAMVISTLRRELGVKGGEYLKSRYTLVTLAYYAYRRGALQPRDVNAIRRWIILSSFSRRYTGRLESDLTEDIARLRERLDLRSLEENLIVRDIDETMLNTPYDKEHILTLLILLRNSYDMRTDIPSRVGDLEPGDISTHHIFPESVLRRALGSTVEIEGEEVDVKQAADLVANITIISRRANERIGDRRPDEYLPTFDKRILEGHLIPTDPSLWRPENYEKFLRERRRILAAKIKEAISAA